MSLRENSDYYSFDNGFVSILIDKITKRVINEDDIIDKYGGRTPAFNNAIMNAKKKIAEYEHMKAGAEQERRDNVIRERAQESVRRDMMRSNELMALRRYKKMEEIVSVIKQTTLIFVLVLTIIIVTITICYPTSSPMQVHAPVKRQDAFYM